MSSKSFKVQASKIHMMGLNAQVLAAQSEEAKAVLGVLVSEIGSMASNTLTILEEIDKGCLYLAKDAIDTVRAAHHLEVYQRALDAGVQGESCNLLIATIDSENRKMLQRLSTVKLRLIEYKEKLRDLQGAILFIPALNSLLNINVSGFRDFIEQFKHITEELTSFKEVISTTSSFMIAGITATIETIDAIESPTLHDQEQGEETNETEDVVTSDAAP